MRSKQVGFVAGVLVAVFGLGAQAQSVSGSVTFEGKAPTLKPVAMDADPACARKHTTPVANEMLVLGTGNTLGNVLVSISKGLAAGKTYPAAATPATLDQKGCRYSPHVLGVRVGQPVKILNSDGVLHNVHALPKINAQFNRAMPGSMKEALETFTKEEGTFAIKCDVHPWMQAYVRVFSHPFFAVTGPDGKFTIPNLEPGTYEVEAWHEKLGTKTASVTIAGKEAKTVSFTFTPPAAK